MRHFISNSLNLIIFTLDLWKNIENQRDSISGPIGLFTLYLDDI